jgi:hypothetical protein
MLYISKNAQMINSICLTLKVVFYYIVEVPAQFFKNKEGEVMKKRNTKPDFGQIKRSMSFAIISFLTVVKVRSHFFKKDLINIGRIKSNWQIPF